MAKTINFSHEGREYKLEFSRKTVKRMEANGFNIADVDKKPLTTLSDLFAGAFKKNHQFTKAEDIDRMQALFEDKDKLTETLIQMYSETIESITNNSNDEGKENLIKWSIAD